MMRIFTLTALFYFISLSAIGQDVYTGSYFKKYPLFLESENTIHFYSDSSVFLNFMEKYQKLIINGTGKLNIVHFGGSHIQADIYSHVMRNHLQNFDYGMNGGRGFIFPFSNARTNNPANYKVSYTGQWESCRNVEARKSCNLGVSGITLLTHDTLATTTIIPNTDSQIYYDFNRVRIFHNQGKESFSIFPETRVPYTTIKDSLHGITTFIFDEFLDTITFSFRCKDTLMRDFEWYGLTLENDDPGVVYHSFGVNGASFPSFLRCNLFVPQLQALKPDLAIVSIGTNDAYTRYFNPAEYAQNYRAFIENLQAANPDIAILLTVPNDSYLYRRYANRNTKLMEEVIIELAKEYGYGVWDFYALMGGFGSSRVWESAGLMQHDKIHFTREGYILKGNLFFQAFLDFYNNYTDTRNISILLNEIIIGNP